MKFSKFKGFLFLFFFFFFFSSFAKAGLKEFTPLDEIHGWLIERKIDSDSNKITCRASISVSGVWFSARIRLNQKDELVIPPNSSGKQLINLINLEEIRSRLSACRRSLIYLPFI